MNKDRLVEIVRIYLLSLDPKTNGMKDIIYHSVGDYIAELMGQGNIPQTFLDSLEEDLNEEVTAIYRKITYGFLTFKEYRDALDDEKYCC